MTGRRLLAACALTAALPAHAVLGEAPATPAGAASAAARVQAVGAGVQVIERSAGDGGLIREFVAPSGVVFEVRWSTRLKPRLDTLLGRYHAGYASAAEQARKQQPGIQRRVTLNADDLVVETSAHLNTFSGRAYAPSLVPAGFDSRSVR